MKKHLFFVLFFAGTTLSAQKNFSTGGIIQWNGDTIPGQVDYREWDVSPAKIQFRTSENADTRSFDAQGIAGFFVIAQNEIYRTAEVYLNDEPADARKMPSFPSVREALVGYKPVRHKVFLRVLTAGKLNLFEYTDPNRRHFLVQPAGDTIRELVARKVIVGSAAVPLDAYKNQLRLLTAACPSLGINFDRLLYFEKEMTRVADKFNECTNSTGYVHAKEKATRSLLVMAGAGMPRGKFSGPFNSDKDVSASGSIAPMIGLGLDFNFSRARGRRGAGVEMYFTKFSIDDTSNDFFGKPIHYYSDLSYLRALVFLRQDVFTGAVQPYLKAGLGAGYYFTSRFKYTKILGGLEPVAFERETKKNDVCFMGGIGVRMHRFMLETRFEWGSNLAEFDASEVIKANLISLVAGYRLNR